MAKDGQNAIYTRDRIIQKIKSITIPPQKNLLSENREARILLKLEKSAIK
jgi:hypothetical protein